VIAAERPLPPVRTIGWGLVTAAWLAVTALLATLLVLVVVGAATGVVGPLEGTPIAGLVILTVLLAPLVGYLFVLVPFTTVTQTLIAAAITGSTVGGAASDPPAGVNVGRRVPLFEPRYPSPYTASLVRVGELGRAPHPALLIGAFLLGAAGIFTGIWISWPTTAIFFPLLSGALAIAALALCAAGVRRALR